MQGDVLVIREGQRRAARQIFERLYPVLRENGGRSTLSVAGESGSGKSEIAHVLQELFQASEMPAVVLGQDDYYFLPPKSNEEARRRDLDHVGVGEVNLEKMDENLRDFLNGAEEITKPLVFFRENRIGEERLDLRGVRVLIVEGTYVTLLDHVHYRVFLDLDYNDTRARRAERAREAQDDFLEQVLKIEHEIISAHKSRAQLVVNRNYELE